MHQASETTVTLPARILIDAATQKGVLVSGGHEWETIHLVVDRCPIDWVKFVSSLGISYDSIPFRKSCDSTTWFFRSQNGVQLDLVVDTEFAEEDLDDCPTKRI